MSTTGYYDEITGDWVSDPNSPTTQEDIASGPSDRWWEWSYDKDKQVWTDPEGKPYDLSYLTSDKGKNLLDRLFGFGKKLATGKGSVADYGTTFAGLMMLRELMGKDGRRSMAYKGPGINMGLRATRGADAPVNYTPYSGNPVMGQQLRGDVTYAAEGGIMGLARGGSPRQPRYLRGHSDGMADKIPTTIEDKQPAKLSHGEFVIPADVVSHLGNGNSDAGAKVLYKMMDRVRTARTGTKKQGRRINPEKFTPGGIAGFDAGGTVAFDNNYTPYSGNTVMGAGTANKTAASNDFGFTRDPNTVGAMVMTPWYNKRTGQTYTASDSAYTAPNADWVQGTLPTDFKPMTDSGGATGGTTGGTTGGAPIIDTNLASWAGPYVTDYLSKAQALAKEPYKAYTGPLVAGTSPLQKTAFTGITNLSSYSPTSFSSSYKAPSPYTTAAETYSTVSPTSISSGYQAPAEYSPTAISSKFVAPDAYQVGKFDAGFNVPDLYQAGKFDTGLGAVKSVQDYMSPYQQSVIDIQAREARRQADIGRTAEQARLAQAGAYGGSRQAIMEAERQRNLNQQIGDIQEKGLQSAFDRATQQRLQEAGLGLQAQEAAERAKQFGATQGMTAAQLAAQFGLEGQRLGEQSKQFGATQAMQAAQIGAQLGLDADKANEMARQFAYGQKMTAAEIAARFNLTAAQANQAASMQAAIANQNAQQAAAQRAELSRQFGATQAARAAEFQAQQALEAAKASELSKQFGATQGLRGLELQMKAGEAERAQEQQGIDALYNQWREQQLDPYKKLQFQQSMLQGLPVGINATESATTLEKLLGGAGGLTGLYERLKKLEDKK